MTHTRPRPSKHPSQAGQAPGCNCLQREVRKDIPDPHRFPQKAPLLAAKTLSWQQEQLRKCCFSHGLRKLSKDVLMSLAPPSLGKQEAPESTGPDHVLGRGYLLYLDGLELNSRYPTTTSCVCLCQCCYF